MDKRLASLDAYRGLVLALMMGEALRLCGIAAAFPASALWAFLCHHQDHVAWVGGSLHDLIQPGFSFLVGIALPFSLAARAARGEGRGRMLAHAVRRGLILVALGIALRSLGRPQTYFTFEDTLTQIGLGYPLLVLVALGPRRLQWLALAVVLVGFWAAFAFYPAPGAGFGWEAVGVPSDWPHRLTGFAAHWNKNENFSAQFDRWFLNLFPREQAFAFNRGGYQTLSFVPTLATMILGLAAGRVLRSDRSPRQKGLWLVIAGVVGLALGSLLGALGLCPVVKRIWTPSFALWSGGFLLPVHRVLPRARRRAGAKALGVSARGPGDQLDRGLLSIRGVHGPHRPGAGPAPAGSGLPRAGAGLRGDVRGSRGARRDLADPAVDASPQGFRADLSPAPAVGPDTPGPAVPGTRRSPAS